MTTEASTALPLDRDSIDPAELSIPALMRELNLQKRPSWFLRKLMNHLESKRQARGMGWSRPWNKIGLTVFRTHKHDPSADAGYLTPVLHLLGLLLENADTKTQQFAWELIKDPGLMVFTFFHNRESDASQYEGLTLSLGRKVLSDPTKRDRLDFILEDRRNAGQVDGKVDLARLYACPWGPYGSDRSHTLIEWPAPDAHEKEQLNELYRHCIEFYHRWKSDESHQWGHWASNYIDYFGPRAYIPQGTSFF
jgi:hypothetical protein